MYTIKQNDQQEVFRARYAAKGFSQIPDLDHSETFSPFRSLTARLSSIHLVDWLESNTYISKNDQYRCHQSDFKVLKKTSGILDTHELRMIKQKYRTLKNHQELKLSYKRLHFFFPQRFFPNLFFFPGFLATSSISGLCPNSNTDHLYIACVIY